MFKGINVDQDLTWKWDAVESKVADELEDKVKGPEVSQRSFHHYLYS